LTELRRVARACQCILHKCSSERVIGCAWRWSLDHAPSRS
jgi:hypothetical protein